MRATAVVLVAVVLEITPLAIGRQHGVGQILAAAPERAMRIRANILARSMIITQQTLVDICIYRTRGINTIQSGRVTMWIFMQRVKKLPTYAMFRLKSKSLGAVATKRTNCVDTFAELAHRILGAFVDV